MNSEELLKKILEDKKQRIREIIYLACNKEKLPIPKINFSGCPQETQDQLGHYHQNENKICISVIQLYKLKSMASVEETIYHELAHISVPSHGDKFIKTKNKLKLNTWRPPRGVIFISGEQQREPEKRPKERLSKISVDKIRCNYHLCRKKRALSQCPHCKSYYCKEHIKPVVPAHLGSEWSVSDSGDNNYHPCPEYVDFLKEQKEREIDEYGRALDALKSKAVSFATEERGIYSGETSASQPDKEPEETIEAKRKRLRLDVNGKSPVQNKKTTANKDFKPWFLNLTCEKVKKWLTDKHHAKYTKGYNYKSNRPLIRVSLPIKAFLVAIAAMALSTPPLNLISYGGFSISPNIFSSTLFFVDFVILLIVILLYDKLTARKYLTYQALVGSFLLSLLFVTGLVLNVTNGVVINLIITFFVLWIGFLAGGRLYDLAQNKGQIRILSGGTKFLILLWLVYLVAAINSTTTGTNFYALLNNFVANLKTGTLFSGSIQPQIVTTCVSQLNQEINIESQKLSQGASISIANLTTFNNYSTINPWIVQWAALPSTALFSFQQTNPVNCSQGSSAYICKDLSLLINQHTNNTNATTLGELGTRRNNALAAGAIIKVVITQPLIFTSGTYSTSYLLPVLCNASGTLLPNSKYYLSH